MDWLGGGGGGEGVVRANFCFSCKWFAKLCKEMYEKLAQPGKRLAEVGDHSTQNNFSLYKQGLSFIGRKKG